MAKIVAIYKTPKDAAAFDRYYFAKHVPLAKTIPGLRSYEVNSGPIGMPIEPGNVHLIATLAFDDPAAIQAAFASPQGQATVADLGNFADGGVDVHVFDTKMV